MEFQEINPFIRFAEIVHCSSDGYTTYVRDCRIFYVLSGNADIRIENQVYTLKPHTLFYCRGGCQYSIISQGIELISLNFDLTQDHNTEQIPYSPIKVKEGCVLPASNHTFVEKYDYLNHHFILHNSIAYHDSLRRILDEYATQRVLFRENCSGILKSVLVQLYRRSIESTTQSTKAVLTLMAYINANYEQNLTNQHFSKMTGYHDYYLNRLFTKHTGFTIHQYILNVRIAQAKQMLLNTDLTTSAIAEKIGFNSSTHFSSYFKQTTEMTPLEFRKQFKNKI